MPHNPGAQNPFPGPLTQDGYQRISGTCGEAADLNLFTGNLTCSLTIVDVPTVGLPLRFVLTYNSQAATSSPVSPVGQLWQHNYQMNLAFNGAYTSATFTDPSGRQYGFVLSGGTWGPDGSSYFTPATLAGSGSTWTLTYPDGTVFTFTGSGTTKALSVLADPHGNTVTLAYDGSGRLTSATEGTGSRAISFGYVGTSTFIHTVTDPRSKVTTLTIDATTNNLTNVAGPTGCSISYAYGLASPNNHLMTARTDPNGNTCTYSYNTSVTPPQLSGAGDAEGHSISYLYDTVGEANNNTFARTRLHDARGKVWEYRFDAAGNPWRCIDPLSHWRHWFWDTHQRLLYESAGFASSNQLDNINNMLRRFTCDASGNVVFGYDASGIVTQYAYDASSRLLSAYPGQGNQAVQGHWVGAYGADGYVLCAFNNNGTDRTSLPGYVTSYSTTGTAANLNASVPSQLIDPRVPLDATSLQQSLGVWKAGGSFTVTLQCAAGSFNLSVYTHSADFNSVASGGISGQLFYSAQTGRDVTLTVTDSVGTQSYRAYNNAPGTWATFPVTADGTHAITLTVAPNAPTTDCHIGVLAFDPYDNHKTTFTYNSTSDLLTATDGFGNADTFAYNIPGTGTLKTYTDKNGKTTSFFYTDAAQNLTQIKDANLQLWNFTYDLNSNLLTAQDPNSNTWVYTYDDRNRLLTISDPLSPADVTTLAYDNAGNLASATDPNGNKTQFQYTASNRLSKLVDALGHSTLFSYDGSGNLVSVTDALNRVTQFQWDDAERLAQVTQADGTTVAAAYDVLDRLRALTTPNGTQNNLNAVNLTGALNRLQNPGAETVDPNSSTGAQFWKASPAAASNVRDTTTAHTGAASLKLATGSGIQYWSQGQVPLPAGTSAMLRFWAQPDGTVNGMTVKDGVELFQADRQNNLPPNVTDFLIAETASPATTLGATQSWTQVPWFRFSVPGDSQYTRYTTLEVRTYATTPSGSPTVWFDDYELYALSVALNYDLEGRFQRLQAPDGASATVVRDRFGRVQQAIDPRGKITQLTYDRLDRVVAVRDPLGNVTQYSWDKVGNLLSFTDPNGKITQYAYENMNRLQTITYPDSPATTEGFTYDNAGRLATYTNNRGQQRTFAYDNANRLTSVTYPGTPATTVLFTYDKASNVLTRTERNGDIFAFGYDALNRLVGVTATPGGTSSTHGWTTQNVYDAVGNRIEFDLDTTAQSEWDVAKWDQGVWGTHTLHWAVPSGGIDAMDRLLKYQDRLGNQTAFAYDVEGRRTLITFPFGSPAVATAATYDVVGKLLSLDTAQGTTDYLPLGFAYDAAANRVAATALVKVPGLSPNNVTYDYAVDDAGRLVEASLNRFTERSYDAFRAGSFAATQVDSSGTVGLLPFTDAFGGTCLASDRWRTAYINQDQYFLGAELRQNGKLQFAFPRGYNNRTDQQPGEQDLFGPGTSTVWYGAEHRTKLSGDFDVSTAFADFYLQSTAIGFLRLQVADQPLETTMTAPSNQAYIQRTNNAYNTNAYIGGTYKGGNLTGTSDVSGSLRIARTGSTLTLYWGGTNLFTTYTGFSTADLYLALVYVNDGASVNASVTGLTRATPTTNYPASGTYTSLCYDAGSSVTWGAISWNATVPGGTALSFQVATSNSPAGPWIYMGPTGTGSSFTTSGTALQAGTTGRYMRYQATLTGGTATPTFNRVDITYTGANGSVEVYYQYDGAGNMTVKTTDVTVGTTTTTTTETRTINALNQITANQVVVGGGGTTNWSYTFDASGNMKTRSDGTNTTTYNWDEDSRLTSVVLPGAGGTISYTYDTSGRMLTRTDGSGTTKFVWDGMAVVAEFDPSGNETRYYNAPGRMFSFERGANVYQVHFDPLSSVRLITDNSGNTVSHWEYDVWGNQLGSSSDGVSNGFMYRFVGSLGVRWDNATGLYYMSQRWYDPILARFLSRDPVGRGVNRYLYAANNPVRLLDPLGLQPDDSSFDFTFSLSGSGFGRDRGAQGDAPGYAPDEPGGGDFHIDISGVASQLSQRQFRCVINAIIEELRRHKVYCGTHKRIRIKGFSLGASYAGKIAEILRMAYPSSDFQVDLWGLPLTHMTPWIHGTGGIPPSLGTTVHYYPGGEYSGGAALYGPTTTWTDGSIHIAVPNMEYGNPSREDVADAFFGGGRKKVQWLALGGGEGEHTAQMHTYLGGYDCDILSHPDNP